MKYRFELGDFSRFVFTIRRMRPCGIYETPFDIEGAEVVAIDAKNIWLVGTDEIEYLVSKSRVTLFIPMVKINLFIKKESSKFAKMQTTIIILSVICLILLLSLWPDKINLD